MTSIRVLSGAEPIARREIWSGFSTLLFYVIGTAFVLLTGFFFFSFLTQFNAVMDQAQSMPETTTSMNHWIVTPLMETMEVVLVFFVPLLTMRLVAEERSRGTLDLLLTSPVSVSGIIAGKFLAFAFTLLLLVALGAVFPLSLALIGNPEVAPILSGLLGLYLFGLGFGALGLAISAFTSSQTMASIVSLFVFLFVYLIDTPAAKLGGWIGPFLQFLTPATHTDSFAKGLVTGVDVMYFVSLIALGLFVAARALELRRAS